ncbi:MAG TPA: hypothetical protein VMC79_07570 [Rectinemataceae bacterium]|nr:hypothetical protein [Rectinemataceae bacterium]
MLVKSLARASLPVSSPPPAIQANAAGLTQGGGQAEGGQGGGQQQQGSGVDAAIAAIGKEVPTDIVTVFTSLFAVVNVTDYGNEFSVRLGLLVIGAVLSTLYFVATRMKEGRDKNTPVTWHSTFSGKPLIALGFLLVSFLLWGLLVMNGKQGPRLNLGLVIAVPIWIFAQNQLRGIFNLSTP